MKRRLLLWFIILSLLVSIVPSAFAAESNGSSKTKTVWVIVSKTNNAGTDSKMTTTYKYNSKGLIGSEKNGYGTTITYTYNKKNLLTKDASKNADGVVTATTKYYYSKRKVKKQVQTYPDSDDKYIRNYTWKNGGKTIVVREGFSKDENADVNDRITYTVGADKRVTKSVVKNSISDFTYWYKYDKNGRRIKAYLKDKIYGPTKKTLRMTYKFKENKNDCVVKDTMVLKESGREVVTTFRYKKIKVPASVYEQVLLQQRYLHGWTVDSLALLTD